MRYYHDGTIAYPHIDKAVDQYEWTETLTRWNTDLRSQTGRYRTEWVGLDGALMTTFSTTSRKRVVNRHTKEIHYVEPQV